MVQKTTPRGYSLVQILLHWIIAVLVAFQLIFHEGMEHAYDAFVKGEKLSAGNWSSANIHVTVGFAVLTLMVLRFIIRLARGVPDAPTGQSAIKLKIAAATQHTLYTVIFLMPITGALAWFAGVPFMAVIHQIGMPLIILAVLVHTLGALMQHFVAKTDVLVRMLRPGRTA